MSFWNGFRAHGDQVFTFIALAAAAFQGQTDLPAWVLHAAIIGGILATAAHQSFFPTAPPMAANPTELKQ